MGAANETGPANHPLEGLRILVVEDDFFIGLDLTAVLSAAGATVVGPFQTVQSAQSAIASAGTAVFSAAILDIRLASETVAPVARSLSDLHVPFLFYTGQAACDPVAAEWRNSPVVSKPAPASVLVRAVTLLVDRPTASSRG